MAEEEVPSEITGYISIGDAARSLGVVPKRVYAYIEQGRLKTTKIAGRLVVSEESLQNFKLKTATGRPRSRKSVWRISPKEATFVIESIFVSIKLEQRKAFIARLKAMSDKEEHLFPGTIERYILEDDNSPEIIEIDLMWKQNEMPDEATYQQMLEAFKADFADVLNWESARYSTKTVLVHT